MRWLRTSESGGGGIDAAADHLPNHSCVVALYFALLFAIGGNARDPGASDARAPEAPGAPEMPVDDVEAGVLNAETSLLAIGQA